MSDQATQQGDTGTGFITGADPRQRPMTQAEISAMQNQQPGQAPVVIVQGGQNGNGQGVRMFTEEEVGAIRTEEKTKLYDRMTGMETELNQLREDREKREAALAEEQTRIQAEATRLEEEKLDVRQLVEKRDQEWSSRFAEMETQRERDQAIFEQERQFSQLQEYRRDRLEQEQEWIFPELRDLIQGASPSEIDQSIEVMKQRTATIMQNVQGALVSQRGPIRGVAPTGAPPIGPMEQQTQVQTLSAEDIRGMDNATFARYREQLLGMASRAGLRKDNAQ